MTALFRLSATTLKAEAQDLQVLLTVKRNADRVRLKNPLLMKEKKKRFWLAKLKRTLASVM
jgi:hypothetical protein